MTKIIIGVQSVKDPLEGAAYIYPNTLHSWQVSLVQVFRT